MRAYGRACCGRSQTARRHQTDNTTTRLSNVLTQINTHTHTHTHIYTHTFPGKLINPNWVESELLRQYLKDDLFIQSANYIYIKNFTRY